MFSVVFGIQSDPTCPCCRGNCPGIIDSIHTGLQKIIICFSWHIYDLPREPPHHLSFPPLFWLKAAVLTVLTRWIILAHEPSCLQLSGPPFFQIFPGCILWSLGWWLCNDLLARTSVGVYYIYVFSALYRRTLGISEGSCQNGFSFLCEGHWYLYHNTELLCVCVYLWVSWRSLNQLLQLLQYFSLCFSEENVGCPVLCCS